MDDVSSHNGPVATEPSSPGQPPPPNAYYGAGSIPPPVEQPTTQWVQGSNGEWNLAASDRRWRRYVPASLIVAAVAVIGTTAFFIVTNEIGTHDQLRMERSAYRRVSSKLAVTSSELAVTQSNLSNANNQIGDLQNKVSGLQGTVSADQQLATDVASVTDSLETCVTDSNQFESDFAAEEASGFFSPTVSTEAAQADSACAQAQSQYNTLAGVLNAATSSS